MADASLPHLDYLLPNDEHVTGLAGEPEIEAACRAFLDRGVGCVAATCGGDGVLLIDTAGIERVPAFAIDVVDTTGCGDAFSAGFLAALPSAAADAFAAATATR